MRTETAHHWTHITGTYAEIQEAGPDRDSMTEEEFRELDALYEDEGHFVRMLYADPDDPDGQVWIAGCSCGATTAYEGEPVEDEPAELHYYHEVRSWAIDHRIDVGLEPQRWYKGEGPGALYVADYREEGHCVIAATLPPDDDGVSEWVAFCTCFEEGDVVDGENCIRGAEDDVRWWADEHRISFGLDPQQVLPHPSEAYSLPEGES